jgi:hypothetical protein
MPIAAICPTRSPGVGALWPRGRAASARIALTRRWPVPGTCQRRCDEEVEELPAARLVRRLDGLPLSGARRMAQEAARSRTNEKSQRACRFARRWIVVTRRRAASALEPAKRFNGVTKYVATHRPESLGWQNSRALGPDVVGALRDLKKQGGPLLLTQGSSEPPPTRARAPWRRARSRCRIRRRRSSSGGAICAERGPLAPSRVAGRNGLTFRGVHPLP